MRITLFNDKQPSIAELQEIVDGCIKILNLPNDIQMVINQQQGLIRLEVNPQASALAKQTIVGNVALLGDNANFK